MEKEYAETLKENFDKIAEYIKQNYPHAIKLSYDKNIKCDSPHHVYYTSYIVLSKGDVQYHFGSHGWSEYDEIYSADKREWVSSIDKREWVSGIKPKDKKLEKFILEWKSQKMYIDGTLGQYEKIFNFEV